VWHGDLRRYAAWGGLAASGAFLTASSGHAEESHEGQEDRVQRLERRMDAILKEVEGLRDEVARARQRPIAADDLKKVTNQLKGQCTPVVVNGKATDYENAITTRAQVDF
jgi:hypothetical protein